MYAVIKVGGHQFRVQKGQELSLYRLPEAEGEKVVFDNVLLIDNAGKIAVGTPYLDGAGVTATVVAHFRDDKVLVFKKKRRKGYQTLNGHRQYMSRVRIEAIAETGVVKPVTRKEKKSAKAEKTMSASTVSAGSEPDVKAGGAEAKTVKKSEKPAVPKKSASGGKKAEGTAKKPAAKAKSSKKDKE